MANKIEKPGWTTDSFKEGTKNAVIGGTIILAAVWALPYVWEYATAAGYSPDVAETAMNTRESIFGIGDGVFAA